jgi:uncharacterized protein (DUF2147 family)
MSKLNIFRAFLLTLAALTACLASAQTTPVGTWQSIDDETGKPSAEIQFSLKGDELVGNIIRGLLPPKEGDEPNCTKCVDDRKDKPKRGLEIIRGLKQTAGTDRWEGGTILDPNQGKIYKLRVTLIEGGAKLQVRGYIGIFYRTQTWNRVN